MKQITSIMMEIIEELGQIPMETIEDVAELQEELKKAGHTGHSKPF